MLQVMSAPLEMFRDKNMIGPRGVRNAPKTTKIEGYYPRFQTFPGPRHQTPWDVSQGRGMSSERTLMACNEYMNAFTYILGQFWVA